MIFLIKGFVHSRKMKLSFCGVQGVETSNLSAAASHFLCCLLVPHFSSASNGEETKKRSRRRGRGGGGAADSSTWTALGGNELWSLICQDAQETYRLKEGLGWAKIIHSKGFNPYMCLVRPVVLSSRSNLFYRSNVDHVVEQYGLQKISLLREMCLKTGIQVLHLSKQWLNLNDYNITISACDNFAWWMLG